MRVIVIVDDIQILHRVAREGAAELYIKWGLPSTLGIDGEVGWFPIFHTWKDIPMVRRQVSGVVSLLEPVWQVQSSESGKGAQEQKGGAHTTGGGE